MLLTGRQAQYLAAELWHRAADVNTASITQTGGPYTDLTIQVHSPRGTDTFVLPPNGEPVNLTAV